MSHQSTQYNRQTCFNFKLNHKCLTSEKYKFIYTLVNNPNIDNNEINLLTELNFIRKYQDIFH